VDDATRAVVPLDPEVLDVGDAIRQGPQWRSLIKGAVRPVRIVEVLVFPQHRHQVALVGWSVVPRTRMRRLPCSMTART